MLVTLLILVSQVTSQLTCAVVLNCAIYHWLPEQTTGHTASAVQYRPVNTYIPHSRVGQGLAHGHESV